MQWWFQFLTRNHTRSHANFAFNSSASFSFNSSLGITRVHTTLSRVSISVHGMFQFLTRNHTRSHGIRDTRGEGADGVSIPHSESHAFTPLCLGALRRLFLLFQFLTRNHTRSHTSQHLPLIFTLRSFNSSLGITRVHTGDAPIMTL